jgi:hypothetical protein
VSICNLSVSLTSALDGDGWSVPRPGRFTPGKENRYPLHSRLVVPQNLSGRVGKQENFLHFFFLRAFLYFNDNINGEGKMEQFRRYSESLQV